MSKVGVIIGSSRPGRIGVGISEWVLSILPKQDGVSYELVDLKEEDLPMFDEVMPPMFGQYNNPHTIKWSGKVKELDGFVVVSPEYNAGYPAVLKNAIDYLKAEWQEKPISVVTYGFSGGASANNQLREVFTRIGTKLTETHPELTFAQSDFSADGKFGEPATVFEKYAETVTKAGEELLALI